MTQNMTLHISALSVYGTLAMYGRLSVPKVINGAFFFTLLGHLANTFARSDF